jgi:hypothetical protein
LHSLELLNDNGTGKHDKFIRQRNGRIHLPKDMQVTQVDLQKGVALALRCVDADHTYEWDFLDVPQTPRMILAGKRRLK